MGNGCCKADTGPENNPDGSPKEPQTLEQEKQDPIELRKAAKDADVKQMLSYLERMKKAQINSYAARGEVPEEESKYTALHYSAQLGHVKGAKTLVAYGANVNLKNGRGKTPLALAVEGGKQKMISWLLSAGADINIADITKTTPLLFAVQSGRKQLVQFLLSAGSASVDFSSSNNQGDTLLLAAARNGWFDILTSFMDKVSDDRLINKRNDSNESVLGWILKFGCGGGVTLKDMDDLVKKALEKGADLKNSFPEKVPPVSLAASSGSFETYQYIAQRALQANPKALQELDALKRTPLHYAAAKGKTDICKDLVEQKGLNPAQPDKQRNTPMHLASLRGHSDVAAYLIETAKDVNTSLFSVNKDGLCAYHLSLSAQGTETSQDAALAIIDKVDPELTKTPVKGKKEGSIKCTALMLAVKAHQDRVVKKLLELGHDVNGCIDDGSVPLEYNLENVTQKTQKADAAIFRMLIEAGAKIDLPHDYNYPSLAVCRHGVSEFSEAATKVLEDKCKGELNWNKKDEQGRFPLHLAALNDNYYMVNYLIDQENIDVNQKSDEGMTPVMYASRGAAVNSLKRLLNRGAEVASGGVLQHALIKQSEVTLDVAQLLLMRGAKPENVVSKVTGEGFLHRAIRYGAAWFIDVWAQYGGDLAITCTTPLTPEAAAEDDEVADADAGLDNLDQKFDVTEVPEDEDQVEFEDDDEADGEGGQAVAEGLDGDDLLQVLDQDPTWLAPERVKQRHEIRVASRKLALKQAEHWFDDWVEDAEHPFRNDFDWDEDDPDEEFEKDWVEDIDELSLEDLRLYMLAQQVEELSAKQNRGAGPVAESDEEPLLLGDTLSSSAGPRLGSLLGSGNSVNVVDPYYQPESRYGGMPKYINVDTAYTHIRMVDDVLVRAQKYMDAEAARIASGQKDREEGIMGRALTVRNLQHFWTSLSPNEFALKLNDWKKFNKRMAAVKTDIIKGGGKKGKKKGFLAKLASLFTFDIPESVRMFETPALVFAVRMGRLSCVNALLRMSAGIVDLVDGYNCTALQYAMLMLARYKHNKVYQNMVDLLMFYFPDLNRCYAKPKEVNEPDWKKPDKGQTVKRTYNSPGVMHPLVLTVLMNDESRLLWLVQKLAGNLDTARVWLPDVPIYMQGLFQKQAGRTECKVVPLHLAVLMKRFGLIKLLLDLGADPNVMGLPLKHEEKMAKIKEEIESKKLRQKELEDAKKDGGVKYALAVTKAGFLAICIKIKDFAKSVELPGLTKPHPWVNPLHLAAREGLSDLAMLLIKRGAFVGGNIYAMHVGKSPLVEALNYARKNCRAYNTGASQNNWKRIESFAYDDIPTMPLEAAKQMTKDKAKMIARAFVDPTMMAIKAAIAAVKFIIQLIMDMKKRPISHHDPAVWCAHVLLLHRIPVKPSDTQTQIALRDIMDNSYYKWLDVKVQSGGGWSNHEKIDVEDNSWLEEVEAETKNVKANFYSDMESEKDWKQYNKMKAKYKASVERAYYQIGAKAIMRTYELYVKKTVEDQKREVEEAKARARKLLTQSQDECLKGRQKMVQDSSQALSGLMDEAYGNMMDNLFEFDESALTFDVSDDMDLAEAFQDGLAGAVANRASEAIVDGQSGEQEEDPVVVPRLSSQSAQGVRHGPRICAPAEAREGKIKKMIEQSLPTSHELKRQAQGMLKSQMRQALGCEELPDVQDLLSDKIKEALLDPDLGLLGDDDGSDEYMEGCNLEMDDGLNGEDLGDAMDMISDILDIMENFA